MEAHLKVVLAETTARQPIRHSLKKDGGMEKHLEVIASEGDDSVTYRHKKGIVVQTHVSPSSPLDLAQEDWTSLTKRSWVEVHKAIDEQCLTFHVLPWGRTRLPANASREVIVKRAVRAAKAWMSFLSKNLTRKVVRTHERASDYETRLFLFYGVLFIDGREVNPRNRR